MSTREESAGSTTRTGTKERLVQATIAIIRSEGLAALTTVRITAEAGIAQPRFYRYFDSVEKCQEAAAEQVVAGLKTMYSVQRIQMTDGGNLKQLATHYRGIFDAVLKDRVFYELRMRYRSDPSPLGQCIRKADQEERDLAVTDLQHRMKSERLSPRQVAAIPRFSDVISDSVGSAVMRVLYDPSIDPDVLANDLAAFTLGGLPGAFRRIAPKRRKQR